MNSCSSGLQRWVWSSVQEDVGRDVIRVHEWAQHGHADTRAFHSGRDDPETLDSVTRPYVQEARRGKVSWTSHFEQNLTVKPPLASYHTDMFAMVWWDQI